MQGLEMEGLERKQVFLSSRLNQVLDSLLISSDHLWLKSELLQSRFPLRIEILQIVFIKRYYHTRCISGAKIINSFEIRK